MNEQDTPEGPRKTGPEPTPRTTALQLHRDAYALQTEVLRTEAQESGEDALSIKDLLRIIYKHKWTLLLVTLLCGAISTVQGLRQTPIYRASTMLQVERNVARIVSFNKDVDSTQDTWDDGSFMRTQLELLRSRSLAERVIDEMGIDPSRGGARGAAAFQGAGVPAAGNKASSGASGKSLLTRVTDIVERVTDNYTKLNTPSVLDKQVLGREALVAGFMGSIGVDQVPNSKLVRISVVHSQPDQAARIANAVAQTFMTVSMERKMESTIYAKNFLEDQIKVTKAKLEESERLLNAYAKNNSILTLDNKSDVINQSYSDYSAALSKAEQERIRAEALYNEVSRNPESAPMVLESKTIATFKEQKAKLEAEYLSLQSVYKADFPKMVQLRAQIGEIDGRIKAEIATVATGFKAQFEAAKRQEELVRARLSATRKEVQVTQDRSVDLNLLRRELDTNRLLYDGLLQRMKEVGVTSGLTANNVTLVDDAKVPLYPFSPQPERNAMMGLGLGLLLGLGIVFLREQLDDSIKSPDEVDALFGLPLLGLIPFIKRKNFTGRSPAMLAQEDPRGAFAEAYRSMRTALQFSTTEGAPKRLMITSCGKAEGKSTTALALAVNFAQLGHRVLLIDSDMRNPSVHRVLDVPNQVGLSNFLTGDIGREKLIQSTRIENLSVMTAGPPPPNPVDLLMGPKLMRLLERAEAMGYKQIIIDGPPILGLADAVVLGNQIQFILFAVKAGHTRRSAIKDSLRRLRIAGLLPIGVVMTHANQHHSADYSYEAYYGYGYSDQRKPPGAPDATEPELEVDDDDQDEPKVRKLLRKQRKSA